MLTVFFHRYVTPGVSSLRSSGKEDQPVTLSQETFGGSRLSGKFKLQLSLALWPRANHRTSLTRSFLLWEVGPATAPTS